MCPVVAFGRRIAGTRRSAEEAPWSGRGNRRAAHGPGVGFGLGLGAGVAGRGGVSVTVVSSKFSA